MYRIIGILIGIWYKEISRPCYFNKGYINITENNSANPHGHTVMCIGNNWISHFIQNREFVYASNQLQVHYFRYGHGNVDPNPQPSGCNRKTITQVAQEVIDGLWGNGDDRRKKID